MKQGIVNGLNTALQSFNFQNWKILVESYRISIPLNKHEKKNTRALLSLKPTPMLISKTAYKSIYFPDVTRMQWFMILMTFARAAIASVWDMFDHCQKIQQLTGPAYLKIEA